MKDVWKLPKYNVVATLQCAAGNRRTAMSKTRTVKGVGWDVAAIGNAVWGRDKLADVLELVRIPKLTSTTPSGGKHVEFVINVSAFVYLLLYYLLCKHNSLGAQLKGLHSMLGDLVCWKFHIFSYKPNSLYKRVVCRRKILGIDMQDLFLFSHQLTSKSSSVTSQKLSIIFIVPSLEDPNQSDSQEYAGLNKCGSDSPCAHTMCTPDVQGMPSLKLADTSNWAIPYMSATA